MKMNKIYFHFIITRIFLISTVKGFFDNQPKIITENGNLVFESVNDRNITFRLKGKSCININDQNILNVIGTGTAVTNGAAGGSRSVEVRIEHLEYTVRELEFQVNSYRSPTEGAAAATLSNTTAVGRLDPRIRRMQIRLSRLETRINELVAQLAIDECRTNPCLNGGTCIDLYNGYSCHCPENWEGPTCTQDVNECSLYAGTELGCQNGGECRNTQGGYLCVCVSGWQGIKCNTRTTSCTSPSASELCGHGICVQTNDAVGYKCICEPGWMINALTPACTVDIDECASLSPHCSMDPQVTCINLPGTFMCGTCPTGYKGNGHYCSDIDECEINNGGCSTAPSVPCLNTRGSYRCGNCPNGWQGDGKNCVQMDGNDCSACHMNASCSVAGGNVRCYCNMGFTGNGYGSAGCSQLPYNSCLLNPCMNGGTCSPNGTSFVCTCRSGYSQPICSRARNPCGNNPCLNGGTCVPNQRNFRCRCTPSFTGNRCQRETAACGGLLTTDSGVLKYPPIASYPHNSRCAWLIRVNVTQVLNITFTKFNLEYSGECFFDWLQIHDGRSSSSYMIGRFCGNDLPKGGNFVTTQNTLYLWFRSDNSTAHDGFELQWDSINPICGGYFNIEGHGTISSPGSPGNYPPNRNCEWQLVGPAGKRIQLHFFTMQIESHETCQFDYLAIHAGLSTTAPLLQKFCNTSHPEPIIAPANEILLYFHSDQDGTDAGFQIHYSLVEGQPGCGGTFTSSKGEFGSPMVDGQYPFQIRCEYLISVPIDNRITIKFKQFELEESSSCSFDFVELFERGTTDTTKIGKWCGSTLPPDYTSNGNKLLVVFQSDISSSFLGFRLSYDIVCGGTFQQDMGTIQSPLYPHPYDERRFCIYNIEAPLGKAIVLEFIEFELEHNYYPECQFDYLSIYDGHDSNETFIGKYCGSTLPPKAISTLNHLHLNFHSDESITRKGFMANYSFIDVGCGGIIKKAGHTISPPMDSGQYHHNTECKWVIVAPVNNVIQLTFTTFNLEDSSECEYDSVSIFDGSSNVNGTASMLIGKFCDRAPPIITSTRNVLTITFVSDFSNSGEGFQAIYSFINSRLICGGKYYSPTGLIRSPGYPTEYGLGKLCEWVINAPTGQQIELLIHDFELEESSTPCSFDYLEIRNGGLNTSPVIGKYCGTEIPKRIVSFTNQVHIKFESDSSRNYRGFELEWDASLAGCGGAISNSQRGSISSPNYPLAYGNNAQCDWRLTSNPGSIIQIIFVDMDLEDRADCDFDSLEIYDGVDSSAKSLGKYCNYQHPLLLQSSNNNMFLRLKTDISNQGRGFEIRYLANCTREIHLHRGIIESPNFPNEYPTNTDCQWTVHIPQGNRLYVEFSHFTLEETYSEYERYETNCQYDYLEIIEKDGDATIKSEKHCKKMPIAFTATHTSVVFKFITDSSGNEIGFHLEYEVQGCGGILTHPMGNITSPNYPGQYSHNTNCEWTIISDYDHLIEITFNDIDLEVSADCSIDGLMLSNAIGDTQPFSKFCGKIHTNQLPTVVTSNGHEVFLKFISDASIRGRGFSATYRILEGKKCGGLFRLDSGFITSPKYPQNYDDNLYCEWLLETDVTHRMNVSFTDFDVEDSSTCEHDWVKIYDGNAIDENKLLGRFCGNTIPSYHHNLTNFQSTFNQLLIVMHSDSNVANKGFKAEFKKACGARIIVNNTGIMTLRNDVLYYNEKCIWTLIAPTLHERVVLTVLHIENFSAEDNGLGAVVECDRKFFIYDGDSVNSPLKQELCSRKHPPPIISSGNALTMEVNLPYVYYADYFIGQYSILDNTCGGEFSSFNGQIASPNYPNSYPINVECVWNIFTSPGNKLLFTIEMIDIKESPNCNEDYLEVRDGVNGPLLGVFCGQTVNASIAPSERLWIKFRSDSVDVGRGFLAEYSISKFVEHTATSGTITSPDYPITTNYNDLAATYAYRIEVAIGFSISLIFKEFNDYSHSHVSIFDGYDRTAPEIELTEESIQDSIISSTNIVYISYATGYSSIFSSTKFKLEWTQIERNAQSNNKNNSNATLPTNSLECTGNSMVNLDIQQGILLQSPGFPYGYNNSMNCSWTFLPAIGYRASVYFNTINLEDTDGCLADYITVSSSRNLNDFNQLGKLCTLPLSPMDNLYNGDPYLKLNFITDYYTNSTGFEAMVVTNCGSILKGPNGIISRNMTAVPISIIRHSIAPNDCVWEIVVRIGRTIRFEFETIDIPTTIANACDGYVLIRNGASNDSPFLGAGKFCGRENFEIPLTTGNHAYVRYVRNVRGQRDDFVLKYSEVEFDCGGSTILNDMNNSTIITTPNYPNIPSPHIECIWTMMSTNGAILSIEFLERFDLTTTTGCDQEYVELRDGGTQSALMMGKFCEKMPVKQLSTSNMLRIKYFTDVSVPRNGFKAKISIGKCGGYYNSKFGTIKSSGYPGLGAYPENSECEYIIHSADTSVLNITFVDLDLPGSIESTFDSFDSSCNNSDHIVISSMIPTSTGSANQYMYFPGSTSSPDDDQLGFQINEIGKYCGTMKPPPIISESNQVVIKFITKNANHIYRGFRLVYNSTTDKCGGTIVAESGVISTPSNVNGSYLRRFCVWFITVPKGRRINLKIIDAAPLLSNSVSQMTETNFVPRLMSSYGPLRNYSYSFTYTPRRISLMNQRVAFYNDHQYSSRIIFISDNNYPSLIQSTDNKMLINLWARFGAGRNFQFNFTSNEASICQGDLDGNQGTITPPRNISSFYCEYSRTQPFYQSPSYNIEGNFISKGTLAIKIKEQVLSFNVTRCYRTTTGIAIKVKNTYEKEVYRKCTGNTTTVYEVLSSPFADTKLIARLSTFISISDTVRYTIEYKLNNCGGILQSNTDKIITAPISERNGEEITCAWQYDAIAGSDTQITITHDAFNCDQEYIEIYNGEYVTGPKIGTYCGASTSMVINSKGHRLYIHYYSMNYNNQSKFQIQLSASDTSCGGTVQAPVHLIRNPRNFTNYPNLIECIWNIQSYSGSHIGLEFLGRFQLEDSTNCTKDYLEIYNRYDNEWKLMDRLCGRTIPSVYNSTGTEMRIIFRSDAAITGDGFQILWQANCGGVFTVTEKIQEITSPNYPSNYRSNLKCNYTLLTDAEKSINVNFLDFSLEDTTRSCIFDNLTVYRDSLYTYPVRQEKVGTYCWNASVSHFRLKHRITFVFQTDANFEKRGFKFQYNLDLCGGLITNSTMISSPRTPLTGKYVESLDCMWNITAPVDKKITIRFESFDLEHGDQCYMDYVDVFEGHNTLNVTNRQARLCGNLTNHAPVINIDNTQALLHFHTDATNNGEGFNALILLVQKCDNKIELKDGRPFILDKTSNAYAEHLDCHYTVTAAAGHVISLEFSDFHVAECFTNNDNTTTGAIVTTTTTTAIPPTLTTPTTKCTCDYVKVHDGAGPFAEVLGVYCGHKLPPKIISSRSALWIRFATDSIVSSTGFRAILTMEPSLCGAEIYALNETKSSVNIVSPGYNAAVATSTYPANLLCEWTIKTEPYDKIIEINFDHFDLQEVDSTEMCNHDYLEIIDFGVNNVIREGLGSTVIFSGAKFQHRTPYFFTGIRSPVAPHQYCDSGKPPTYYSSSNSINIRFKTDATIEKKGFSFTASLHESCSRNFTQTQGRIFSKVLADCETYITVPENYTISLYFSYVTYYSLDPYCTQETPLFTIYDGRNNSVIERICTPSKPNPIFTNTNMLKLKFNKLKSVWPDYTAVYDFTYIATDKGLGCGGSIFNYAGVFTSPMYPLNQRNYSECLWEIIVPVNTKVALQFEIFDLGSKATCNDNYLRLIENLGQSTEYTQTFCGEDSPAPYKSRSNVLHVKFKKTVNFSGTGWIINFMSVTEDSILNSY